MRNVCVCSSVWPVPFAHFSKNVWISHFIRYSAVCVQTLAAAELFHAMLFMIIHIFNALPQQPLVQLEWSRRLVSHTHFDVLWCLNEKQRIVAFSISMKMQLCHLGNGCVVCDSHLMWWRGEHTKETRNALIHSLALTKSHISHTRLVQIRVFGIASHSCTGVCVCVSAGNNVCLVAFVSQCN